MWSSSQRSLHVYIDLKLKNRMDRKQESIYQWFCYFPLWSWFETIKHFINQVDLTWLDLNSTLNRWTSSTGKCIAVDFRPLIGLRSMIWYCALCIFNQYNVHSLLGRLRRVLTGNVWVDSRWGTPEGKSTVSSFRWSMCFLKHRANIQPLLPLTESDLAEGQIQTIIRNLSPYSTVYGQQQQKHLLTICHGRWGEEFSYELVSVTSAVRSTHPPFSSPRSLLSWSPSPDSWDRTRVVHLCVGPAQNSLLRCETSTSIALWRLIPRAIHPHQLKVRHWREQTTNVRVFTCLV